MDIRYTDQQIAALIEERKVLPDDWRTQLDKNNSLYIRPYNDLIVSCSWFMIKSGEIS